MKNLAQKQIQISFTFLIVLLLHVSKGNKISCPILQCAEPSLTGRVTYDLCYNVTIEQPMKIVQTYDCDWYVANEKSNLPSSAISYCDFTAKDGKFAWVDEATQGITSSNKELAIMKNSQFNKRKTEAYCRTADSFMQNLNNGRSCKSAF